MQACHQARLETNNKKMKESKTTTTTKMEQKQPLADETNGTGMKCIHPSPSILHKVSDLVVVHFLNPTLYHF